MAGRRGRPRPDGPAHGRRGARPRRELRRPGRPPGRADRRRRPRRPGRRLVERPARSSARSRSPGVTVRDLGEHRLKDLRPERLGDLRVAGLAIGVPAAPHGRPADGQPAAPADEPRRSGARARDPDGRSSTGTRLLTLTGPGGDRQDPPEHRRSRRPSRNASRTACSSWPSSRSPTRPSSRRPSPGRIGIIESGSRTAMEMLLDHVAERRLLLVLDNFEQVVAAAPTIGELLRAGPRPHRRHEQPGRAADLGRDASSRCRGLPAPPDPSRLSETDRARLSAAARRLDRAAVEGFEAVRLFVARGAAARPGFELTDANAPTIARICARLDGLPLAIELAAARLRILAPEAILERLERQLRGPRQHRPRRAGAPTDAPRARSPGATTCSTRRPATCSIAWRSSWTASSSRSPNGSSRRPTSASTSSTASAPSSTRASSDGTTGRRATLHDARGDPGLRRSSRLTARGEVDAIRERHARAYLDLAEAAEPNLAGDAQRGWLERLERENENFRAALTYATERPLTEVALRLVSALWRFWQKRGYLTEARRRADAVLALPGARDDPRLAARAFEAAGGIAWWQGQLTDIVGYYTREPRLSGGSSATSAGIANALYNLGLCGFQTQDWDAATSLLDEAAALFTKLGDDRGIGNVEWAYGQAEFYNRDDAVMSRDDADAAGDRASSTRRARTSGGPASGRWRPGRSTCRDSASSRYRRASTECDRRPRARARPLRRQRRHRGGRDDPRRPRDRRARRCGRFEDAASSRPPPGRSSAPPAPSCSPRRRRSSPTSGRCPTPRALSPEREAELADAGQRACRSTRRSPWRRTIGSRRRDGKRTDWRGSRAGSVTSPTSAQRPKP